LGELLAIAVLAAALPAPAPADTGDSAAPALEEVVVTAAKELQSLQKTPAAVTAIDGDALVAAGVTDIRGAQDLVPSVRFQQQNAATEIYIRGVGSTLDFPQVASPNAFNLNGISVPREGTSVPLYDVAQLEVLPGPQGTLYGSGALGGAVNVNFRRPTFEYETRTLLEIGDFGLAHVTATENVPFSPEVAARMAVDYLTHEGYEVSGADSQKDLGARLSVLYRPNDAVSAYLWGSSVTKEGHPPNLVPKGINPTTGALSPNTYLTSNPWNDEFPRPYSTALPYGQPRAQGQSYFNRMAGGELDLRVGGDLHLSWTPSYLVLATAPDYWLGAFPGNETDNYRQVTNEFRATGKGDWGSWIAGLYAYDLDSNGIFTFGGFTPATGFPVSNVGFNRIEGEAVFGQVTLHVLSGLRAVVGGRTSLDDRIGRGEYLGSSGLAPYTYGQNFHHVDYKIGLEQDLGTRGLLYATTQTGYQPGTFNAYASTPAASNAVNPATLTAYTVGMKQRLLNERVEVNDEIFFYDYRGLFASAYNTVLNSDQTFNAQKTQIFGDQLDLRLRPTASDALTASVGFLNARNIRFVLPDGTANYDGYALQYAPDWTVSARYSHDFRMAAGYLRAAAGSRYEDAFYADFSHTPGGRQQPYLKSDASLTWYSMTGDWSLGAWIKNIENVAVIAATAGGSNLPALATGATAFLEPPRTYGVRATWNP
jgi:iron complex outermembrane receptor protein